MSEHHVGRGEHFRSSSWVERQITSLRGRRSRAAPAAIKRVHEFLLDHLPGGHLVATLPGGERVQLSARYRQLAWNPEEYSAFRAAVAPGATVLDIGANIGAYTVLFALWTGRAGRVVAFEPAPASLAGLARQVKLNGVADRVEIVAAAMSDREGRALFDCDGASGANALIPTAAAVGRAECVRTMSIDAFCAARGIRPDVIKVDVEGAELDVLRGARQTIASCSPALFVEIHPSLWPARGYDVEAFRAELSHQGLAAETLAAELDPWRTEGISLRLRRA